MIEDIRIDPRLKAEDHEVRVKNVVIRVNSFDETSAATLCNEVSLAHQAKQTYLPVIVDSEGGDMYALWSMVDVLSRSRIPVVTIIEGKAFSSGSALFMCGWEGYRFIGPNASMMIHDGSGEVAGKASDMKVEAKHVLQLNQKLYYHMEKRAGKPRNFLWNMIQKRRGTDWYITPKEAVQLGLANHVKIPTLRTEAKVHTSLIFSR
jgi:ATP-dependent Clp protease protease subunit